MGRKIPCWVLVWAVMSLLVLLLLFLQLLRLKDRGRCSGWKMLIDGSVPGAAGEVPGSSLPANAERQASSPQRNGPHGFLVLLPSTMIALESSNVVPS